MSLYNLLTERQEEILKKCRQKMANIPGFQSDAYRLEEGLPKLYSELIEVLRISMDSDSPETKHQFVYETVTASASRHHAQESFRMGYTVSQLVHGYGSICQGITEFTQENRVPITSAEFSQLNLCLDVAIAQAVSEFETLSLDAAERSDQLKLGFLTHELRNFLTVAMMSHELIKRGGVAAAGATSSMLTNSLQQMKEIIDRALAEVRMKGEPVIEFGRVSLLNLVGEIEGSAIPEANAKGITIQVDADPLLDVLVDRHLLSSAVANLVQNAIKYSAEETTVTIRVFEENQTAVIEVEDRCGGLPGGKTEELFAPYVQGAESETGLGLGLAIARRAVTLNNGELNARDLPGVGCVFTIRLPVLLVDPIAPVSLC